MMKRLRFALLPAIAVALAFSFAGCDTGTTQTQFVEVGPPAIHIEVEGEFLSFTNSALVIMSDADAVVVTLTATASEIPAGWIVGIGENAPASGIDVVIDGEDEYENELTITVQAGFRSDTFTVNAFADGYGLRTITVTVLCPVETLIDNLPGASALAADEDLNEAILGNLKANLTERLQDFIQGGGTGELNLEYLVTPSNDEILPELHDLGVHVWFTGPGGDGRILHGAAIDVSEAIAAPGFDINLNDAIAAGGEAAIDGVFEALDVGALLAEDGALQTALVGIWEDNAEAFFEAFLDSIIEQITEGYCYCQS